jgi:hypothetical protein
MEKYEVLLNCFSGFYESIHSGNFDSDEEMIIEDFPGKSYDDFRFTQDWNGYCKNYVSAISSEINIELEFMELTSPREYNFATDQISVYITTKELKKISSVLDSDTLKDLIRRNFTSRDGFISWYSNDIEEWKEKKILDWNCVELGILLDAWIIENESEDYYNDLDVIGMEYCRGNGQYVDYEKLWDVEAEMQLEQEKTAELCKLETWKKNVADW